jgi:hypothetical protein
MGGVQMADKRAELTKQEFKALMKELEDWLDEDVSDVAEFSIIEVLVRLEENTTKGEATR